MTIVLGTHLIALACDKFNIPCYIACDSSKIGQDPNVELEQGHPEEILENYLTENIQIFNPIFEKVPLYECMKVVTENGVLTVDQVHDAAKEISRKKQEWMS